MRIRYPAYRRQRPEWRTDKRCSIVGLPPGVGTLRVEEQTADYYTNIDVAVGRDPRLRGLLVCDGTDLDLDAGALGGAVAGGLDPVYARVPESSAKQGDQ